MASTIPQMTVLGIAGPGDPLANPEKTFKTFELISKTAPDIKLCLSTNGLTLPDHVDTIAGYNVDHVTITINMVDPEIGAKIYPWVFWKHKRYTGIDAAKLLTTASCWPGDAHRPRHPHQDQFGDDPRHQ